MFNDTKYTRWYYSIVSNRAITDHNVKCEVHHIVPRSLGGTDDAENLVKLSGHDHALCHWLLTKMTTGTDKAKMVYAFNMMAVYGKHMDRPTSAAIVRAYEHNREEWSRVHSELMTGRPSPRKGTKITDPEALKNIREGTANRVIDPVKAAEGHRRGAEKRRGQKRSDETRKLQSESAKKHLAENPRGPMSDVEKEKRSKKQKGVPKQKGHGSKVAAANRGVVSINKNGIEKKVKAPDLQTWLNQGWSLGGRPRKKK